MRLLFKAWLCACLVAVSLGSTMGVAAGRVIDSGDRYTAASAQAENYQLGTGDKVKITVFNEPTLSGEFTIGSDGSVSLPLIGSVGASGKTASQLALAAQTKLSDGYLRNPQVGGEVTQYRPFFILGEVKSPGQFPYAIGLTVYNAVATAQGFSPRAERKVAYIRSAGSNEEQAYKLTPDLKVLPGDTIRIGERYF